MNLKKSFVGMERIQESIHATERNLNDVEKRFLDLLEKDSSSDNSAVLSDSALSNIGEIAEQIAAMRVMVSKFWRDIYLEYYSKQYPINDRRNN